MDFECTGNMENNYTIVANNVYKKYSTINVLSGLSLKVPTGCTYGLIGPSGCGKTTLLKCILGRLTIDSGSIELSVKDWINVGFMPQELCLHSEFKIKEIFVFYGTLFGIQGNILKNKVNDLMELLELPPPDSMIVECSGGQQRRISLAVTLLHNPDLLLLDEPTVGLDPVLGQKICNYLKNLSTMYNKTILITTHYMEEARSLDVIGLLRGGVLLTEKSPTQLINDLNCSSLEDAFLALSTKQESRAFKEVEIHPKETVNKQLHKQPLGNDKSFSKNHLKAQIYKNHIWTLRNIPMTLFVLILPVITSCINGAIFRGLNLSLPIGYYSEELDNASCEANRTVLAEGCLPSPPLTCQYVELLEKYHVMERYNSKKDVMEAVRKGHTYSAIVIPYNFSNTVMDRITFQASVRDDTTQAFDESPIQVWMDNSVYVIVFEINKHLYSALHQLLQRKCEECGINIAFSRTPINFKPVIYGENTTMFSKMLPPFIHGFLFYTTYLLAAASLQTEKSSGTLERVQMNGMTTTEILMANVMMQFIVVNLQNVLTLFTIHMVLQESYLGNLALMYIILLLSEVFGSILGLYIITFTDKVYNINCIGLGLVLLAVMSNGMIWPAEGIYWMVKPVLQLNPVNKASDSYCHVMLHGFSLSHPLVYHGIIYIITSNVILAAITAFKIKRKNNRL